ncbi:phytanoyl-CoA dioxygenase family protein [Bacillus pseudomycoides]|uniref:phytanoyl-CoA dioxygenase family protein n=1 Tax=Bacillus TaxID=1386 RepID=UPI00037D0BC4|nr:MULTISPECIES: phytanoyl-CoA dioxygenase family protein [Bacillus]MCX2829471.1 phytanoyl-CoA dioxygenase family protein [Bacillus sp. DHT2]MDR4916744.1 phytanoyl-CoA dioxygenase family protein [Bacillus pseudomycoides]
MLSKNLVDQYEKEGYLNKIPVFDKDKATMFRSHFDSMVEIEGLQNKNIKRELHNRHIDQDYVWDVAISSEVLDVVESLIGENIFLIGSRFVCKWPGDDHYVPWHQDSRYQELNPPCQVSVWIAIDDCDIDNGCLYVIPGSNNKGLVEHKKAEGNNVLVFNEVSLKQSDEEAAIPLELKAGEMSVFHGDVIHGSPLNQSTRRRCGLVFRYVPTWVKPNIEGMWPSILVRGTNKEKNFPNITRCDGLNFKYITK